MATTLTLRSILSGGERVSLSNTKQTRAPTTNTGASCVQLDTDLKLQNLYRCEVNSNLDVRVFCSFLKGSNDANVGNAMYLCGKLVAKLHSTSVTATNELTGG